MSTWTTRISRVGVVVGLFAMAQALAACKSCTRLAGLATEDAAPPLNGWQQVMAGVKPDGSVPREMALRAFAFTYGPIPGVEPPPADASVPPCGTLIPVWLAPYAKTLDKAQRKAVLEGFLGKKDGGAVRNQLGGGGGLQGLVEDAAWSLPNQRDWLNWLLEQARLDAGANTYTPTPAELDFFNAAVDEARRFIAPHSPAGTPFTVHPIFRHEFIPTGTHTLAEAFLTPSSNETLTSAERTCHVRVFKAVLTQPNRVEARAAVIHEIFHCYQLANFNGSWGDWTGALNGRPWWMEGAAAWVGEKAVGGAHGHFQNNWMGIYLRGNSDGNYDLYTNSYDAIGAFDHLDTGGTPVLRRLLPMVREVTDPARLDFLIEGDVTKLKGLASGAIREPSWGAAWDYPGPLGRGIEGRRRWGVWDPAREILTRPAQQWAYRVPVGAAHDLALVRGTGAGTVAVGGRTVADFAPRVDKVFCFRGDCRCPDGQPAFGITPQQVQGDSVDIAVVGLPSAGAQIAVRPLRTSDACAERRDDAGADAGPITQDAGAIPTGPFDRCLIGTWQLDTTDARGRYQDAMREGRLEVLGIRGGQKLTFAPSGVNGTFGHQMLPMIVLAKGPPGSSIDMTIEFNGATGGAARTAFTGRGTGDACNTRGVLVFERTTGAIEAKARIRIGTVGGTETKNPLDGAQLGGNADYRVEGNRLTMTPRVAGGIVSVYSR